jgi:excisionase family DNA binding protein
MVVGASRLPDYLTTEEVANILGYNVQSVRRLVRSGKLRADKKVGVWLIPREAVGDYKKTIEGKAKNDPTRGR